VDGLLEGLDVGAGGLAVAAEFADELERRGLDVFVAGDAGFLTEGLDAPAHEITVTQASYSEQTRKCSC
jgi:hypothetical protein